MDRHRGDPFDSPDSHSYRNPRGPSRSSDGPINHQHRSPNNHHRGGFSAGGGGGRDNRPFDSPPRYPPAGGTGGFRPMGPGAATAGFNSEYQVPLTGQKRGFPFSGRGGSPDHFDGGSFAKLFVGSVPRTCTEEDIRPLFEEHGRVVEVALIRDKRTGLQQGCCFIKYATSEEADRAIRSLHNQHTLPGGLGPIQVRYADGERERLVEYKLFVGSLNKQATEKDVEEIFSPYGRVEDVYLMRDEMKQSRGCGFVKYSQREMALAAINNLNGIYVMRGCDQPLSVRFADPKRPRPGEGRGGGPAFGGPGFGPRFQSPGIRPTPNFGEPMRGNMPPNAWHPMSPHNMGPSSNADMHGFGNQLLPRSGDTTMPSTLGGPFGGPSGSADGSGPSLAISSSSMPQQNFNQSSQQAPQVGQQISPLMKPNQSPQQFPSSLQLQQQNQTPSSYSQTQTSGGQLGQPQGPNSATSQMPFGQMYPPQQMLGLSGQLPVSQPQVQPNASFATAQTPLNTNLPPHVISSMPNQQQQQLVQPLHQSPSQLAQMLSQQTQTLQASFQSSQQAFSQLQQQLQLMQPSNQNVVTTPQNSQAAKQQQQSQWAGMVPQTVGSGAANPAIGDATPAATSAAPVATQAVALVKCSWTEHTSPDGYKYYYNSTTGESKWEKPEELTLFEQQQQQQQQKPSVQQPQQSQSHSHGLATQQQVPQNSQVQQLQTQLQPQQLQAQLRYPHQLQQPSQSSMYQVHGVSGQQNNRELGYNNAQLPVAAAGSSVKDPARFQQGLQVNQEWAWKNKSAGT